MHVADSFSLPSLLLQLPGTWAWVRYISLEKHLTHSRGLVAHWWISLWPLESETEWVCRSQGVSMWIFNCCRPVRSVSSPKGVFVTERSGNVTGQNLAEMRIAREAEMGKTDINQSYTKRLWWEWLEISKFIQWRKRAEESSVEAWDEKRLPFRTVR